MKRNYLKIVLPTILTILLFILTIFLIIIPRFQDNIMDGKREMIKELTNSAWSILAKYEKDEKDGLLSKEDAQNTAKSRIQYLRYGDESKDYFWITDMRPFMVMHPFRSDLDGKDLSDFTDPHGKKLFVEFVETVKKSEHGYVDYMWQWKDDSLKIVPKLSYVRIFKPWNWVIGTGIYIEDVKKEISALTKRLLWISVGITIIISLLLLYISNQSLNAEKKRITAENELKESKERYRALVEAATEGLIMLSDGKISFSNNVIGKITGFDNSELINRPVYELISKNNNADIIEAFSQTTIKEGQFELNLSLKTGGMAEVAVTSSLAQFYGKNVNILIVKDISTGRSEDYSKIDYQKLIGTLNLGFFKARIDNSAKIIYANETALRILGFESISELSKINILRFFTDHTDRKTLRNVLNSNGFVKNKILKIYSKNKGSIISLSLVLMNDPDSEYFLCDGIIEDITGQEKEREYFRNMLAELKTINFRTEQPVGDFIYPVTSADSDITIGQAIELMYKRKTDTLLITKNTGEFIGIVTSDDVQNRVLKLNLSPDNPVYLIMSSPVIYSDINLSVGDALTLCREKKINHLIIKDCENKIKGQFSVKDIYKRLIDSLQFLNDNVSKAENIDEIRTAYLKLQAFVTSLINSDMPARQITRITSSFSDSVIKRVIELVINDTGEPPVPFSFICLGSEGRMEESLLTDQDNAIVFEDVAKEREAAVQDYFIKLGGMVCDSLNSIGYKYCKGNIMAKNPMWNKPISQWEKYFTEWITTPEPQNLLDAIIFFDFRNLYGDKKFCDRLKQIVETTVGRQNVFVYHLALNTYNTKPVLLSSGGILTDKPAEVIDLKACIIHIVMFARTYSLQNNIWCTNTIDRLNALKSKQIIPQDVIDEMIYVYGYLMKLRLKNQAALLESKSQISNLLNTKNLGELEYSILKKVLAQIPVYQNRIGVDFRLKS